MKFLWQLLLVCSLPRYPDPEPAADPVADPAGDPPADPGAGDPPADPAPDPAADPSADPAADPAPAAKPHGNTGKTPWYLNRINEETNAKNREKEGRLAAERRAQEAEALAASLRAAGGGDPAAPAPRSAAPQPQPQPGTEEFERAVEERAALRQLYAASDAILQAGLRDFPDFDPHVKLLATIGVTSDDVLSDLVAVDQANAHKILEKLALDPEKAARIVSMNSRSRTAEFTRMSMAETSAPAGDPAPTKPAAPVSRAPRPAAPVAPAAGPADNDGLGDDVTDEQFSKNFDKKYGASGAR